MDTQIIYIIIAIIVGGILGWIIHSLFIGKNMVSRNALDNVNQQLISAKTSADHFAKTIEDIKIEKAKTESALLSASGEIQQLQIEIAAFRERYISLEEKEKALKEEMESIGKKFSDQFEVLANKILEEKSEKFTKANSDNLKLLLDPLGLDIKNFKQKVEEVYINESKERFSLKNEINKLNALNIKLSDDAHNLTKALKGDTKTQGDWGEIILESILQRSGLTPGREYFIQDSYRDTEGNLFRPDVIVALPNNRKIIIDSKVSLTAYERFISADNETEQAIYLKKHLDSIYSHIDLLAKKNYQDLLGDASLDLVLMFVPIEPAHITAMHHDPELWAYAYNKGIVLVSPYNLLSAMKLISDLWQREKQNRNAMDIADRSGALYDKFVSFTDTLRDLGMHINRSHNSYEEAIKQLTSGKGNIISQVEKMKTLGAKAKKEIPEKLLQLGLEEDEE
ncbi:MAG: DNA recombination protein RmuC [Chitinophagales bacterium]|nr:DNA recombination protein RmuC [Chitinophagales bacterium]MBP9549984.1 DNA recombination protein RmuC [Chitinophagales bacterium]